MKRRRLWTRRTLQALWGCAVRSGMKWSLVLTDRHEMARTPGEKECRWFDMIRWGLLQVTISKIASEQRKKTSANWTRPKSAQVVKMRRWQEDAVFFCTTLKSLHVQTLCRPLATYIFYIPWCGVSMCVPLSSQCSVQVILFFFSRFCLDGFTRIFLFCRRERERERKRNVGSCAGRCLKSQHVVWCLHCQYFIVHC